MVDYNNMEIPGIVRVIHVYRDVLFPGCVLKVPVHNLPRDSLGNMDSKVIGIIPTGAADHEELKQGDIGTVGALLSITMTNMAGFASYIVVFGLKRFTVKNVISTEPHITAEITVHHDLYDNISSETLEVLNKLKNLIFPFISRNTLLPIKTSSFIKRMLEKLPVPALFDIFFSVCPTTFEEKLDILRTLNIDERVAKGIPLLMQSFGFTSLDENKRILQSLPTRSFAVLRLQRPPLKDSKDFPEYEDKDITELSKRLQNANLPENVSKTVMKDLARLKRMSHFSPDHSVLRNYLEFVAELPWSISSVDSLDVNRAREELDADHYGMDKLKKRILEFVAVSQIKSNLRGPILCFVGPPGVGKTSIGRSIARILNKKFQRISLGGVSNPSEIRGHRRTYIGSLPGRILNALKMAGTNNPVILLDEIDKLGKGVMGSPNDALLEVLDPEQNAHFTDHFLGMPFDLSRVTFLATANSDSTIPPALADRMEIIHVSGYTQVEKFFIAKRHLLPKQLEMHGLHSESIRVTDEALHSIIEEYTREAGVRKLEQKLAGVCRAGALKVASTPKNMLPIIIDKEDLEEILGVAVFVDEDIRNKVLRPGVALGLGYTGSGGIVHTVEVTRLGGTGQLTLTGSLGTVMKESAKIALNWVRSVGQEYGIPDELFGETDLHVHFPAGAVSKDGPSAGITIACAILSLLTGVPVVFGLAMTGEITLQGRVLPVGGLNEKLSAANRMGVRKVIIPFRSKRHLSDINDSVLSNLEIVLVENMTEVIETAFDGVSRPNTHSILCSKL